MNRSAYLQAELDTIPGASYVSARTVVALPPSDIDPATVIDGTSYDDSTVYDATTVYVVTYSFDFMRVRINNSEVLRPYDAGMS